MANVIGLGHVGIYVRDLGAWSGFTGILLECVSPSRTGERKFIK
jgi:hypothetical protein